MHWQKSVENIIYLYILIVKTFYFKKGLFGNTQKKVFEIPEQNHTLNVFISQIFFFTKFLFESTKNFITPSATIMKKKQFL